MVKKTIVTKEEREDFVLFDKKSILLFVIFFVIGISFFFLLDKKTDAGFGFVEIAYVISFAVLLAGFLIWTKSVSVNNPYLAGLIGLSGIALASYAFSLKYNGLYSNIFLVITILIVLSYLVKNFIKYRNAK